MKWVQALMEKVSSVFTQKPEETKKDLEFPPFDPTYPTHPEQMDDLFLSDDVVIQEKPKKKRPYKKKKTNKKKMTDE